MNTPRTPRPPVPWRTPRASYSPRQGQFLNVDLEIGAPTDLAPLLAVLEPKLTILHADVTPRRSWMTIELKRDPKSAEAAILSFVKILSSLRGKARAQWLRCSCRSLNIGYDAPMAFPGLGDVVSVAALRAAVSVGAGIAITIYPPDDDNRPVVTAGRKRSSGKAKRRSDS